MIKIKGIIVIKLIVLLLIGSCSSYENSIATGEEATLTALPAITPTSILATQTPVPSVLSVAPGQIEITSLQKQPLRMGALYGGIAWAPDSRHIVYNGGPMKIVDLADIEKEAISPYPGIGLDGPVSWAPQEDRIALTIMGDSINDFSWETEILIYDVTTGETEKIEATAEDEQFEEVSNQLAAQDWMDENTLLIRAGAKGIGILDLKTKAWQLVPNLENPEKGIGGLPLWNEQHQRIVFVSKRNYELLDKRLDVFSIKPDGTGLELILQGIKGDLPLRPTLSPDGNKIAWLEFDPNPKRRWWIKVANIDGSEQTVLLDTFDDELPEPWETLNHLAWSPDGEKLIFSAGTPETRGNANFIWIAELGVKPK